MKERPTQADVLTTALQNKKMFQSELAQQLNLDRPFLNRIMKGKQPLPQDKVQSAADILGIDPDVLYITAGQIPPDVIAAVNQYPTLVRIIRQHKKVMDLKQQEGLNRRKKAGTMNEAAT
jgi:transcriptional regulator with XRE-family HTH domain